MKVFSCIFGALCAALAPASIASAKTTRLQTVNITERQLSLEGGEAILYRVDDGKRRFCRIEVIHYGETGKAIYVFDFAAKLFGSERREYHYSASIYDGSNYEAILTERTTLASRNGRKTLPNDFVESKAFFDARQLAKCLGK